MLQELVEKKGNEWIDENLAKRKERITKNTKTYDVHDTHL